MNSPEPQRLIRRAPQKHIFILFACAVLALIAQLYLATKLGDLHTHWTRQRFILIAIFSLNVPIFLLLATFLPSLRFQWKPLSSKQLLLLCGLHTLLSVLIYFFVYGAVNHVSDESGYQYQAYIFTQGKIFEETSDLAESLHYNMYVEHAGKQASPYTFGWPLLLALGIMLGCPWLVNPILGGLSVWLLFLIAEKLYDSKTASLAALLLAISPFHLFMSATRFSHTSCMFTILLAMYFLIRFYHSHRITDAILVGFFCGFAMANRQLTTIALFIPVAFWWMGRLLHGKRKEIPAALACLVAMGFWVGLMLWYNHLFAGDWKTFPVKLRDIASVIHLGFGKGIGPGHSDFYPHHGLFQMAGRLFLLSSELFGWPLLSLLPFAYFISFVKKKTVEKLFLACSISLVVGYMAWGWMSEYYGPRYYFEITGLLCLFSARGALAESRFKNSLMNTVHHYFPGVLPATILFMVIFFGLLSLHQGKHYLNVNSKAHQIVRDAKLDEALVFVRLGDYPWPDILWTPFFEQNLKSSTVLFARFADKTSNRKVLDTYKTRTPYLLQVIDDKNVELIHFNSK